VPRWRTKVLGAVRQAYDSLRSVMHSPQRIAQMLVGNVGTQLLYALCLGASLHAFGYGVPLTTLIIVNNAAALVAGLSPVPGGLGAAEAALVAGLTAAGVPSVAAVPAVLTHRLVTSWLTPILGWFALRDLQHHGEV
jgi:uncharacterized protein (TIRG00374 family)